MSLSRRTWLLTVSLAVVLVAAAAVLFILHRNAEIGELDNPSHAAGGQLSANVVRAGGVVSLGGEILCVTGKYPATITSVTPVGQVNGFVVQAWGVRPNTWHSGGRGLALGADYKPLSAFPDFTHALVTGKCDSRQVRSEFAVQVTRIGTESAKAQALRLNYRIHGKSGSYIWRHMMLLCAPTDQSDDCPGGRR